VEGYAGRPALNGQPIPKDDVILCSNPLTGGMGGAADAEANLGTLVPDLANDTGSLVPAMVPARCGDDGFLYIGAPPDLGPYVGPGNNFHVYDIPLFWANLRAGVAERVKAWQDRRSQSQRRQR
jgi:hypothetical protein